MSVLPSARARFVRVHLCLRRPPNCALPFLFYRSHCALFLVFVVHALLRVRRVFVVVVQLYVDLKVEAEESPRRGLGFRAPCS